MLTEGVRAPVPEVTPMRPQTPAGAAEVMSIHCDSSEPFMRIVIEWGVSELFKRQPEIWEAASNVAGLEELVAAWRGHQMSGAALTGVVVW